MKGVKAEDILYQLQAIAMADVTGLVQVRGGGVEITSTDKLTKQQRCAIASIEKSAGGLKVKFYDKLKALELLGKYMGLFDGSNAAGEDSALLEAILRSTGEVTGGDIPEFRQQAAAGNDLVEPEGLP